MVCVDCWRYCGADQSCMASWMCSPNDAKLLNQMQKQRAQQKIWYVYHLWPDTFNESRRVGRHEDATRRQCELEQDTSAEQRVEDTGHRTHSVIYGATHFGVFAFICHNNPPSMPHLFPAVCYSVPISSSLSMHDYLSISCAVLFFDKCALLDLCVHPHLNGQRISKYW